MSYTIRDKHLLCKSSSLLELFLFKLELYYEKYVTKQAMQERVVEHKRPRSKGVVLRATTLGTLAPPL